MAMYKLPLNLILLCKSVNSQLRDHLVDVVLPGYPFSDDLLKIV